MTRLQCRRRDKIEMILTQQPYFIQSKTYVFWDRTKLFHGCYDLQSKLHRSDHNVLPIHLVKALNHHPVPIKAILYVNHNKVVWILNRVKFDAISIPVISGYAKQKLFDCLSLKY